MSWRSFCLTVPSLQRWRDAKARFMAAGLRVDPFEGLDSSVAGLRTEHTYDVDHPGTNYHISPKHVCMLLGHMMIWRTCQQLPEEAFLILEDDAVFEPNWKQRFTESWSVVPHDWGIIYLGSCCCGGKPTRSIGGGLYEVQWPLCTHAYLVNRKALPVMIERSRKVWAPIDLALMFDVLPYLHVYTILPTLVTQKDTFLTP
jgi:GR25 family glycosyltransferase involved in LPS biosynthesis